MPPYMITFVLGGLLNCSLSVRFDVTALWTTVWVRRVWLIPCRWCL